MDKLNVFNLHGVDVEVKFIEHQTVKDGVTCDIYSFVDDASKDLAIVVVERGYKTPLQKVLSGTETVEGFLEGEATLKITDASGEHTMYNFPDKNLKVVKVTIGQTMQWEAKTKLTFYELCTPPYTNGRFQNLPE